MTRQTKARPLGVLSGAPHSALNMDVYANRKLDSPRTTFFKTGQRKSLNVGRTAPLEMRSPPEKSLLGK
jgi:hypothetical protein